MKKTSPIYFILMVFLISLSNTFYGQQWVWFTGHITNEETEEPVPMHPVFISAYDSLTLAYTMTDENGYYLDSVFYNPSGDLEGLTVSTPDCQGMMLHKVFDPPDSLNIANFEICVIGDTCEAFFIYEPDFGDPTLIYFTDYSYGNYNSWFWDFGDGISSSIQDPSHQYNAPGEYEVCLTISDSTGNCMSTWCEFVFVFDDVCMADFDWYEDDNEPLKIIFEDLSSGDIDQWIWNFGDDQVSFEQSPEHIYDESGDYLVTLIVMDSIGFCVDSIVKMVIVTGHSGCQAGFTAVLDTLNNTPNVYHFTNTSVGNYTNWSWDFGDGTFSGDLNPTHIYNEGGNYQVCLEIFSEGSMYCNDFYCEVISTPAYFNFGGHAFLGDFPLNIEEDDHDNIAIASLYRRYENQWELMDTREFWKYGYYWFVDKPEGEYIVRADLLPESIEYKQYSPAYTPDVRFWENATTFILSDSSEFAVDIRLPEMVVRNNGTGSITGIVVYQEGCTGAVNLSQQLVYLLNADNQIMDYTYTDEYGEFDFDDLGYGTYLVKPELTGKMAETHNVVLNAENPSQTDITLMVSCNSYVGLEEPNSFPDLTISNIYPQPASDVLYVDIGSSTEMNMAYSLINISGTQVLSGSFRKLPGNHTLIINVNSIPTGLYLLKIINGDNSTHDTRKIIIN